MGEHKRELQDVLFLTALQGLNYLAPLIVFPYLMVVLGAEMFGYIGFSLSIIQYLMLFVFIIKMDIDTFYIHIAYDKLSAKQL